MKALKSKTGKQIKDAVAKTEMVVFRVSKDEKRDMQATAAALGLTLTEYLSRIHAIARQRLKS